MLKMIKTTFYTPLQIFLQSFYFRFYYLYRIDYCYQVINVVYRLNKITNLWLKKNKFSSLLVFNRNLIAPRTPLKLKTNKYLTRLSPTPVFNFYNKHFWSYHAPFCNSFYKLAGVNFDENWWLSTIFSSLKWATTFITSFYFSTFSKFKYFYNIYYYVKPQILHANYFPPFTQVNFSPFHLFTDPNPIKTLFYFLNSPSLKSSFKYNSLWQYDFLMFWKNFKSFYFIKKYFNKKLKKRNKLTTLLDKIVAPTSVILFVNPTMVPSQTHLLIFHKFFLIKKNSIARPSFSKLSNNDNVFIAAYFLKKFYATKTSLSLFYQSAPMASFLKKNFPLYFSRIAPFSGAFPLRPVKLKTRFYLSTAEDEVVFTHNSFSNTAFISSNLNFFFLNSSRLFNGLKQEFLPNFKTQIFSFFEKFELHKLIIKNVIKSSYITSFSDNSAPHLIPLLNTNTVSLLAYDVVNNTAIPNFKTSPIYDSFYHDKTLSWMTNFYRHLNVEQTDKVSMKISRIKFKPGYMNYWRNARTELKKVFNLKFTYQRNLTKFLLKFNKHMSNLTGLTQELSLINLLTESKFFMYKSYALAFIKNQFVSVNGWVVTQNNFQLYKNDFIQISIHMKYYIFYKHFINLLIKNKQYVKKVVYFKNRFITTNKQRSSTYPKKLLSQFYTENDIPKYLELDFMSLSFYILYEPFLLTDFSVEQHWQNRFSSLRLYNWKYIT